jgi:predicted FMN-binding regulatory protein PaiB
MFRGGRAADTSINERYGLRTYTQHVNAVEDEAEPRRMVEVVGSAQVISVGADGYPLSTLLPIIWSGDVVLTHMARANPHWRQISTGSPALLVIAGPQAYISPSRYQAMPSRGALCLRRTTQLCRCRPGSGSR